MASMVLNAVQSQLPKLIELYEPQVEAKLIQTLQDLKSTNPNEVALFYTNWQKLNGAVQKALAPSAGKRRQKRTHTIRRRKY